jgi:hypothetical protein
MTQADLEAWWAQQLGQMPENAGANIDPGEAVSPPPGADPGVGAPKVKTRFDYAGLPDCPYTGTGSSQPMNKDGSIPIRQLENGMWEADISANGCNLLFEGRIVPGEELHRVVILRGRYGEHPFVQGGKFQYAEGSIWGYDRTWNMEDFSAKKPPIAAEFVNDKRAVMKAEGYDWDIVVYTTDGQEMNFSPGQEWAGVIDNDSCEFGEPLKIAVHGEKLSDSNSFSAAIGAIGCWTVAWIDGASVPEVWEGQRDAERKVQYTTVEAWMMPSKWDSAEIQSWINSH